MTTSQLQLTTLDGCGLAIGSYPRFRYDASGGQSVRFEGSLNASSGAVHLHFRARFFFRVGRLYRAPGLLVETELTTRWRTKPPPSGGGRNPRRAGERPVGGGRPGDPQRRRLGRSLPGPAR